RDERRGPPWLLLPVMLLWGNLHGSFLFGIALAAYVAGEAVLEGRGWPERIALARPWAVYVLAAIILSLVNPNGMTTLVQPFRLMAMPALQSGFSEWQAVDLAEFPGLAGWLIGIAALVALAWRSLPWTRVLLLFLLVYMALAHVRHADLL